MAVNLLVRKDNWTCHLTLEESKKSSLYIVLRVGPLGSVNVPLIWTLHVHMSNVHPILMQKEKGRQPPNTLASESWLEWCRGLPCLFISPQLFLCREVQIVTQQSVCLSVQINISLRHCSKVARFCESICKHGETKRSSHPSTGEDKNQEGL